MAFSWRLWEFKVLSSILSSILSLKPYKGMTKVVWILMCYLYLHSRYNGYTREAFFSVGLQGIVEEDIQTVCDIIDRTVDAVIQCVWHLRCLVPEPFTGRGAGHLHCWVLFSQTCTGSLFLTEILSLLPCCKNIFSTSHFLILL